MKEGRVFLGEREILSTALMTENALERAKGLLFSSEEIVEQGMIITPCNSVHTFFMLHPLDIIYLDRTWKVLKVRCWMKPWQLSFCFGASMVLETRVGMSEELNISIGDTLTWHKN